MKSSRVKLSKATHVIVMDHGYMYAKLYSTESISCNEFYIAVSVIK